MSNPTQPQAVPFIAVPQAVYSKILKKLGTLPYDEVGELRAEMDQSALAANFSPQAPPSEMAGAVETDVK